MPRSASRDEECPLVRFSLDSVVDEDPESIKIMLPLLLMARCAYEKRDSSQLLTMVSESKYTKIAEARHDQRP